MDIHDFLHRLNNVKGHGGQYEATCPCHDDKKQSLCIGVGDDGKILLYCQAGCDTKDVVERLGLTMRDLFTESKSFPEYKDENPEKWEFVATYKYGNDIFKYRKKRGDKKSFLWKHRDEKGEWDYHKPKRRLLYTAGDTFQAGDTILVVEGEKDVDTLRRLEYYAACGPDGAGNGKWRDGADQEPLRGCHVYVLPDNDDVGREYAEETCTCLYGVAASVHLLDLSTVWPEIPNKGDVSDMVQALGDEEACIRLTALMSNAKPWKPQKTFSRPKDYSDAGNADCFSSLYDDYIYTESLGWLHWNKRKNKWEADENALYRDVMDFTESMRQDALTSVREALHDEAEAKAKYADIMDDESKDKVKKAAERVKNEKAYLAWANKSRNANKIHAVENLSKHTYFKPMETLDADAYIINTPSGIYDLRTGQGMDVENKMCYCTKSTICAPGGDGAEMWNEFLQGITVGDSSLQRFIQEVIGMSLYGKVFEECAILAIGSGRNGKSTFFNAVSDVLGDYAGTADSDLFIKTNRNKGPHLADLRGKRLVTASELEQSQKLSTKTLKDITSTEPIKGEPKYMAPFEFVPTHTIILHTNYLPKVDANDDGTWRRIIPCQFNATIERDKMITNMKDRLVEQCGPAILRWAIDGAVRFWENGQKLTIPSVVQNLTQEYKDNENWLREFIQSECVENPTGKVQFKYLYDEYSEYCRKACERPKSRKDFSAAMDKEGFKSKKPHNKVVYEGLELASY
jgi:P4 family phage/plasmid primase-like protien